MADRSTFEINGHLYEGTHNALIELRQNLGSRNANRMLVHVCETLIEDYPLVFSDLQVMPSRKDQPGQAVKISVPQKSCPRLSRCYEQLPWGTRGAVMLQLMNRLYTMAEADPKVVEQILRRRQVISSPQPIGHEQFVTSDREVPTQDPSSFENRPDTSFIEEEIILTGVPDSPGTSVLFDPDDALVGFDFGGV
jgi:hypothetical protein